MAEQTPKPKNRLASINTFAIFIVVVLLFFLVRYWNGRTDDSSGATAEPPAAQQLPAEEETVADDETESSDEESAAETGETADDEPAGDETPESGDAEPSSSSADGSTAAPRAPPGMATVTLGELPPEALETIALIEAGGPFPYDKDGSTFQNREGLLPDETEGYYAEYTVETPGSSDRGARRIVGGEEGELYYTDDHYASFSWIALDGAELPADESSNAETEDAGTGPPAPAGMATITLDELPPEALETIALIEAGGPFPYDKDGSTFQNREGLLPDQPEGYYAEYTVETPGSSDRGARRIVAGADGEMYYTDDHYASFAWIEL